MSTLALTPPRPEATASTGLRGPARTVVRQHRRTFQLLILLTLLTVAALVTLTLWVGHDADVFARTGCRVGDDSPTHACAQSVRDYLDSQFRLNHAQDLAAVLLTVLPAVYGVFMAGPAIGRELESGTHRLAWTQSVSPARWLTAKLAVPAALVLACTIVLTAVCTWLSTRTDAYVTLWFQPGVYATTGTVPVAYALLGLAAGTLAGVLLRRTFVAMAVAAVVHGVLAYALYTVRDHLWPVVSRTYPANAPSPFPPDASFVDGGLVTATGARLPADTCFYTSGDIGACRKALGVTGHYLDYHPESHFWPLQLVESGILLAVAALALYAAYRLLRRLHA